ncbi:MAG TPA: TIGR03905 family TSCPD domain-containing protein [Candidatus Gallacutalibacter stercoravium]|nr:TIGR03905 family TSCPD domain-containing protein [Candidatus Gallacutalibacter stercoravium]
MEFIYQTKGTCSKQIKVELDGDIIRSVAFTGGCNGNLKGISSLVVGQRAQDVIGRLKGIQCGFKSTSCPDQLANALTKALQQKAEQA